MSAGQYIAIAIGSGVAFAFAGLLLAFRDSTWARRAHKLAAKSDMALPGPLVPKVARFLRDSWLFGSLMLWICEPLVLTAVGGPYDRPDSTRWLPWVVTGLPILMAGFAYALTVWPRWKASGSTRVTHLRRLTVRQAFTFSEASVTIAGVVIATAAGGWGLWLASAPVWRWAAFAAACGVALTAWWASAKAVMGRASNASDDIELGWDDLIRFSRVRSMTIGAAWLPALCIIAADWNAAASQPGPTPQFYTPAWPFYLLSAACVVLYLIYQQGRKLWRQAWVPDGSPQ